MTTDLRIKELCAQQSITQKDLAARLGITPTAFNQAIARNNFDMNYLKRIAQALGVEITELFAPMSIKCPHCGRLINLHAEKGE